MKIRILALCLLLFGPVLDAQAQDKIRVGLGSISLQSGLVHIGKDRTAQYGVFRIEQPPQDTPPPPK